MPSQLSASLLRLKLLDALRGGDDDRVENIIEELSNTRPTIQTTDIIQLRETILHYAVQVAPLSTIQFLVDNSSKFGLDINSQDVDGNTPLHLAAQASRLDVVKYLLSLPNINDTIVNLEKKQPVEKCKDLAIIQLMQFERAKFVENAASQLRQYFSNRDFDNLENLLVLNPRASELLDINGSDPETGYTVLHEFIKKEDVQMCDWILKHGGDPFKRDKKGKLPIELIEGKNDALKKLLKHASKEQNIMDPVINSKNAMRLGSAPTYKGYLRKWTNFASGYKLRYFVLDQVGHLSYYSSQDDTNNACRGSLNLSFATLHLDSSEKLKFEIIGKNGIRWHLKANHPIETNRWVWTLQNAITIAKDNLKKRNTEGTGKQTSSASNASQADKQDSSVSSPTDDDKKHRHLLHIPGRKKHKRTDSQVSLNSTNSINESSPTSSSTNKTPHVVSRSFTDEKADMTPLGDIQDSKTSRASEENHSGVSDLENYDYDLDGLEDDYDSDSESLYLKGTEQASSNQSTSLTNEVSKIRKSLDIEISSLMDLFDKASKSQEAKDPSLYSVVLNTLRVIQELLNKYNNLISSRESILTTKLDRQLEVNKLWESSIRQLENEIAQRENKLSRYEDKTKQLKRMFASGVMSGASTPSGSGGPLRKEAGSVQDAEGSNKRKDAQNEATDYFTDEKNNGVPDEKLLQEILHDDSEDEFFDAGEFDNDDEGLLLNEQDNRGVGDDAPNAAEAGPNVAAGAAGIAGVAGAANTTGAVDKETKEPSGEAVGSVEGQRSRSDGVNDLDVTVHSEAQKQKLKILEEDKSFLGYENPPRTKLSLDSDDRPSLSLWGILKSMIGKDMTKMSLPVTFNECTSLLQRLAEDIEYSKLLDKAASIDDSTLRMVYVATFAVSEYASTVNRIAKPFNPLLGETFEYCRPDCNYRLLTEQVSHHPPVSACHAESPFWDYYGENAVDSQFKGRSFDIKHLGKMFCTVRPHKGVTTKDGKKVDEELYSWQKVNTSVVGIMLGNPTVDNFGRMKVTNHTTGDYLIIDMKPRGWRASSAYQLSGKVYDSSDKERWAVGGHWVSKIFGKKITDSANSDADKSLIGSDATKTSLDPYSGGKFLIWQAAPRPKVPFNLTSFAITLNGIDDSLKRYLPPTDTRLRPDQRAMEEGKYDLAFDEKHRVEEKQRAARKEREKHKVQYKPNWFVRKKHPITNDPYWEFRGDYWPKRRDNQLANSGDIF
ncbi:Piso0_002949 [Millerozyma farinosa CBS 7064]|uniref:Piso0_002949 protein n=1 Tax=Pichia sorbitophila (strain ATCC MYA-4447 / BCRC 22081 / CBS 7064 / NBRC 10061 / NRRL Y-12695) TaxID=559304 RepID=G8YGS0_PICSO|nr:Piso0_002949 [Millerozyma farinosa CBS 7064]CCE80622.1 Piso0_002949 [Millerozyma farinosa CBS 7064]